MIEKYWKRVNEVNDAGVNGYDDQIRVNTGINKMNLQFNKTGLYEKKNWVGRSSDGFTVTILPFNVICRWKCDQSERESYYVWHLRHNLKAKGLAMQEIETLKSDLVWYLSDDWKQVAENSTAMGLDWLREMKA